MIEYVVKLAKMKSGLNLGIHNYSQQVSTGFDIRKYLTNTKTTPHKIDITMSNNPSSGLTYKMNLVCSNSCDKI